MSFYDGLYVALAAALAVPLVTADARLSRAPGLGCAGGAGRRGVKRRGSVPRRVTLATDALISEAPHADDLAAHAGYRAMARIAMTMTVPQAA